MNAAINSPVEYLQRLSQEDKQVVLLGLLREAMQSHGDTGLLPIDDEEGKSFGYYVPPKAAAEQFRSLLPSLTAQDRQVTAAALATLDQTFEMKAFLEELKFDDFMWFDDHRHGNALSRLGTECIILSNKIGS